MYSTTQVTIQRKKNKIWLRILGNSRLKTATTTRGTTLFPSRSRFFSQNQAITEKIECLLRMTLFT